MTDTLRSLIEANVPGTTLADTDTVHLERSEVPVGAAGTPLRDGLERVYPGEVYDDSVLVIQTDSKLVTDPVPDPPAPPDPYSDTFDTDLSKWTQVSDDVTLDGAGHLALPTTLSPTNTAKTHSAMLAVPRSLANRAVTLDWSRIVLPGSGAKYLGVKIARLNNPANYYVLAQLSGGSILFRTYAFGATSAPTFAYTATAGQWRIRDDGTNLLLEISSDGQAWTQKASLPRPTWIAEDASHLVYQTVNAAAGVSPDATLLNSFQVA